MRREGAGHCRGCQATEGFPAAHSAMAASSAACRCMGEPLQLITAKQAFGMQAAGQHPQNMLLFTRPGGTNLAPDENTHMLLATQALKQFSVGGKASHIVAQRAAKALSEHHLLKLSVPTV